ncbi:hypothetical protein [Acinetobacter amyesii]|uniref:hypothetical protein n=1 Tax=Acinetobacter amyesii TaxID=2942470 RepID=UPI0020BFB1F0|nr:hypothetical protein [Acinetobacter amyesii]MCL6242524.1 hypothetical protein [Acinetobacter amyesii]
MAVPVILGIIKIAGYAIAAYELYHVGMNIYTEVEAYKDNIKKAKDEMKKMMKFLDLEISDNIDKRTELAQLNAITNSDKQSSSTTKPSGTRGASVTGIQAAIMQKIPFRPVISKVCETADQLPMVQLRAKRGQKFKDVVPKSKVDVVAKLLSMTAEEFADVSIEEFTIVRLKQLAVNFIIECMDELLTWRGPLKAEVCFPYITKMSQFQRPPSKGTRLSRSGSDINPFWPMPSKAHGTISADIVIPEYRAEAISLTNIFALVEIKFQGDRIGEKQFLTYRRLSTQSKNEKKVSGITVSEGFKLSLFRYPEDATPKDQSKAQTQGNTRGRRGN